MKPACPRCKGWLLREIAPYTGEQFWCCLNCGWEEPSEGQLEPEDRRKPMPMKY